MTSLTTYDISDCHYEVKTAALARGFQDCVYASDEWVKLPNTTLLHNSDDLEEVQQKFYAAVEAVRAATHRRIVIEKVYTIVSGSGLIVSDEKCKGSKSR